MNSPALSADQPTRAPEERYQFKPFIGSSHSWAATHFTGLPAATRVLDVGSGSGAMGAALRAHGVENLSAVEVSESARNHVAGIYRRVEASLDPLRGEQFDLILLLDVLEHMSTPFESFAAIAALLAPGGKMLVSVPNIAHWSVRIPLLFGSFRYTDRGILDRTHLQFFTRSRFIELLSSAPGVRIEELNASIPPAEFALPRWMWDNELFRAASRARLAAARLLPGIGAYQHLGAVRRPPSAAP